MHLVFIHGSPTVLKSDMKQLNCIILFLLVQSLFISCKKGEDEVSFQTPRRRYDIAVEGGINTLFRTQSIRLTRPALSPDSLPTPIRKATVTVNDGKTDIVFKESSVAGVYSAATNNSPNYNSAYKLTITYNNQTYTAVDTLRQVVNIVDDFLPLSVTKSADGNYNGSIPKHTFGYLNPNKWWISYGDIPLLDLTKFDQMQYYNYTHFLGSPNSLYPLNNLKRTFVLSSEQVITIYKLSLSAGYAKYLYSVFLETDWNGLFSSIPVNIEGNISGNAQGYFSVTDIDFRRYRARELR